MQTAPNAPCELETFGAIELDGRESSRQARYFELAGNRLGYERLSILAQLLCHGLVVGDKRVDLGGPFVEVGGDGALFIVARQNNFESTEFFLALAS